MPEFLRERPGLHAILFAIALVVAYFLIPSDKSDAPNRSFNTDSGGEQSAETVKSARLDEMRKVKYQDPIKALAMAEAVVASAKDAKEKTAAQAALPELVDLAFHKHNQRKQYDEARQSMQRTVTEFPDDFRTLGLRLTCRWPP